MGLCRAKIEVNYEREAKFDENGNKIYEKEKRSAEGEIAVGVASDKMGSSWPQLALHAAIRAKSSLIEDAGTNVLFAVVSAHTLRYVELVDNAANPISVTYMNPGAGLIAAEFPPPPGYGDIEVRIGPFYGNQLGLTELDPLIYRFTILNEMSALFAGDVSMAACLYNYDLGTVGYKGLIGPVDRIAQAPRLRSLSPSSGPSAGGFSVTVDGEFFNASSVIMVGDTRVVPSSWSQTQITFLAPAVSTPVARSVAVVNEDSLQSSLRDWNTLVYT